MAKHGYYLGVQASISNRPLSTSRTVKSFKHSARHWIVLLRSSNICATIKAQVYFSIFFHVDSMNCEPLEVCCKQSVLCTQMESHDHRGLTRSFGEKPCFDFADWYLLASLGNSPLEFWPSGFDGATSPIYKSIDRTSTDTKGIHGTEVLFCCKMWGLIMVWSDQVNSLRS